MGAITVAERMQLTNGKASGFDYMRLLLAALVVFSHSFTVVLESSAREAFVHSIFYRPFLVILPMFFALSGFLVAGSFERSKKYTEFYGLRVLRIVPALAVETCISAILLGPIVTSMNWGGYFSDPLFFRYFLNILGHIQYVLPGVFEENPIPKIVNSQLWTIPYELYCYVAIGLIGVVGVFSRPKLLFVVVLIGQLAVGVLLLQRSGLALGFELVLAFVSGVLIYKLRDFLPWDYRLALGLAAFVVVVLPFRGGNHLALFPLVYLTVFLGLTDPPRLPVIFSGDYSYGIYLYGFAIQQAMVWLGPWTRVWWLNFALAMPVIVACAVFSWWFVEKPALRLRKYLRRS